MAVVEEPFINNTAGQSRQDSTTSHKIPRTKPIRKDATPPAQQEDEYLRITVTSLDRTKRDPMFKLKAAVCGPHSSRTTSLLFTPIDSFINNYEIQFCRRICPSLNRKRINL